MKITVLIENLVYRRDLLAEHGLSIHIDTGNAIILFDTGQTGAFAENARTLGIDLAEIDYVILSHGHYDHTGGLSKFLEINSRARIVMASDALTSKYKGDNYIGIPQDTLIPKDRIIYVKESFEVEKSVRVLGNIKTVNSNDTHFSGFLKEGEGELVPDVFTDEVFLVLETREGIHLVSGCSHNGITNILQTAKSSYSKPVNTVIGGFHLVDTTSDQVEYLSEILNNEGVSNIYTGHCTGLENFCTLQEFSTAFVHYMHTAFEFSF